MSRALFLMLWLFGGSLAPADGDAAQRAFENGDFAAAEASYRELLATDPDQPALHYNLGCAVARQGKLGEAVLAFRRCLHLDPRHADARDNLSWVQQRLSDLPATSESPRETLARLIALLPGGWLLILAVLVEWTGLALVFFSVVRAPAPRLFRTGLALMALALVLAAPALVGAYLRASESAAIVVDQRIEARSGPGEQYPLLFTAHEGFEVDVEESRANWSRIRTRSGLVGWVPSNAFERVRLP